MYLHIDFENTCLETIKFPKLMDEGNLVSRLIFFTNSPPNMIYMFNYTKYYVESLLNKLYFLFVVSINFIILMVYFSRKLMLCNYPTFTSGHFRFSNLTNHVSLLKMVKKDRFWMIFGRLRLARGKNTNTTMRDYPSGIKKKRNSIEK